MRSYNKTLPKIKDQRERFFSLVNNKLNGPKNTEDRKNAINVTNDENEQTPKNFDC